MAFSCEISFEKEFYVVAGLIFNSREFAEALTPPLLPQHDRRGFTRVLVEGRGGGGLQH